MTTAPKATILGITLGALLLSVGASPAAADGSERPILNAAYANAPGAITLAWTHSGIDVYAFAVEEASGAFVFADAGKRVWTVVGLQPNTTYRFRVCAVYDYNDLVCSDEGGVGYAPVTTMPPEAPRPTPRPNPAPPPAPPKPVALALPAPIIKAELRKTFPDRADSPYLVHLTWRNPVNAAQLSLLKRMDWYRNGKYFNSSSKPLPTFEDARDPYATQRYRLCIENDVNRICSNEVTIAAVQGKPLPPVAPQPVTPAPLPSKNALPASAFTCASGYVWRVARPSDLVCVTPESRDRVAEENHTAATRVQAGGGAYGPNTCRSGYVWREAFSGDLVCVTPQIRALVAQENQLGASRLASAIVPSSPAVLTSGRKGALPRL
jgi:hypothetical protein